MKIIDKVFCNLIGKVYDAGTGGFPELVHIETTNKCNARCVICPHSRMKRPVGIMDEKLYQAIIDECKAHDCHTVHLHNFGEPLLDPDLPSRAAYAKEKGIKRVKIFTNGSLLSGERARKLLESGIDEIKVSIDGADKEEFESIRLGLKYDRVVSNVREFLALREKMGMHRPKVMVTCCTTSDRDRAQDNLGDVVDKYDFGTIHNWGNLDESKRRRIRKPCSRVWRTFTVLWNGDIALCCLDYEGEFKLGNLIQDGSISRVWKNKRYQQIRSFHKDAKQGALRLCSTCTKSYLF